MTKKIIGIKIIDKISIDKISSDMATAPINLHNLAKLFVNRVILIQNPHIILKLFKAGFGRSLHVTIHKMVETWFQGTLTVQEWLRPQGFEPPTSEFTS